MFRSDLPQAHAVLKISRIVDENEHLMVKHSCLLRNFDDPFTQVQYLRISSDMLIALYILYILYEAANLKHP